ncbi:MAG: cell division control protein Cdc6 [Thermoproteota archaeon]|nr:MAG: cell division control protein Cdc6 [Candidatus Korarchaeota archaeon]
MGMSLSIGMLRHVPGRIIKNEESFSESFIPEHLPHREKELKLLESTIISRSGQIAGNAYIMGRPGLGKTALSLRFAMNISREIEVKYLHVNCRKYRTSSLVLHKIIKGLSSGLPERGLSLQEALMAFEDLIKEKNILIILDEVGYLRDGGDLIYSLFRISEGSGTRPPAMILISREWTPDYLLDRSIFPFITTKISLEPYNKEEILDILRYRAEIGLVSGSYDDSILFMIAEVAARSGDARLALSMLHQSAMFAEADKADKITPEHVRMAISMDQPLADRRALMSLELHEKLLLLAISSLLEKSSDAWIPMGRVEEEYKMLCEAYGVAPFKHTALWRRIKSLDKTGFITTRRSGKGVKGQTTLISIEGAPSSSISSELKKDLSILLKIKED